MSLALPLVASAPFLGIRRLLASLPRGRSRHGMLGGSRWTCEVCHQGFRDQTDAHRHWVSLHGSDDQRSDLFVHACSVCGRRFQSITHCDAHREAVHSDERPFSCSDCSATYRYQRNLDAHRRRHHPSGPDTATAPVTTLAPAPLANFGCPQCSATFTRREGLVRHERIHRHERPFACFLCHRTFTRSDHLRRHEASLTGCEATRQRSQTATGSTLTDHKEELSHSLFLPLTSLARPTGSGSDEELVLASNSTTGGKASNKKRRALSHLLLQHC